MVSEHLQSFLGNGTVCEHGGFFPLSVTVLRLVARACPGRVVYEHWRPFLTSLETYCPHTHSHTHAHVHARTYTHTHTHTCTHSHTHTHTNNHTHKHMCTRTHKHTPLHTHTLTQSLLKTTTSEQAPIHKNLPNLACLKRRKLTVNNTHQHQSNINNLQDQRPGNAPGAPNQSHAERRTVHNWSASPLNNPCEVPWPTTWVSSWRGVSMHAQNKNAPTLLSANTMCEKMT